MYFQFSKVKHLLWDVQVFTTCIFLGAGQKIACFAFFFSLQNSYNFLSMFLIKFEFVFHHNKGISTEYYCGKGFF